MLSVNWNIFCSWGTKKFSLIVKHSWTLLLWIYNPQFLTKNVTKKSLSKVLWLVRWSTHLFYGSLLREPLINLLLSFYLIVKLEKREDRESLLWNCRKNFNYFFKRRKMRFCHAMKFFSLLKCKILSFKVIFCRKKTIFNYEKGRLISARILFPLSYS